MKTTPEDPLGDPQFSAVLERLRAQPCPEPSAPLADRIEDAVVRNKLRGRKISLSLCGAAAAVLLLGAVVPCGWLHRPAVVARPPSPVEILMQAQRSDGGWSAAAGEAGSRYDVGVSALALLALLHGEPAADDAARAAAIRAGVVHLLGHQAPDGRFGGAAGGSDYVHYVATMAVWAASELAGADPRWSAAARRAQDHLPPSARMAKLNGHLARPETFPDRWAQAGGPVVQVALQALKR